MRVAGRRLRVALPLLARRPEGKRVRRALLVLRQLTRTAGGSRDLDVIASLLSSELRASGPPSPEGRTLERRLLAARRRIRGRMAEALLDLEIARLRRDLRRIVLRKGEDLFTALSRLHQQREHEGALIHAAAVGLGDRFDPEQLHELRKRARRLRYAAEVGVALRGKPSDAPDAFRELQGQLGEIHDAHVLAGWLRLQAEQAQRRGQPGLEAEARRLEDLFMARALERHRLLLEPGLPAMVEHALEAMGRARTAA